MWPFRVKGYLHQFSWSMVLSLLKGFWCLSLDYALTFLFYAGGWGTRLWFQVQLEGKVLSFVGAQAV